MEYLRDVIERHNYDYYVRDMPTVPDAEYDKLYARIQEAPGNASDADRKKVISMHEKLARMQIVVSEHEVLGRLTSSTQRMQRLIDQMLVFAQSLVAGIPLNTQRADGAILSGNGRYVAARVIGAL